MVLLLIRYNELGLKSPRVRSRFQKQMITNIENKFLDASLDCFIDSEWGRIYLHTDDQALGIKLLSTVFGISSISPVINKSDSLDEITDETVAHAESLITPGQSFALRTRRTGQHKYTSRDIAVYVGEAIMTRLKKLKLTVNLTKPDLEIFIEVRRKNSFIFSESHPGPGGLPLGTQGKVASIFTDESSFIAAWLMMKRGCRVYPVYFQPNSGDVDPLLDNMLEQIDILKPWAQNIKLKVFEIETSGTNDVQLNNKNFLGFINSVHAKGICLSSDFATFSQYFSEQRSTLPIFYPLIGLEKKKIEKLGQMINDNTSSLSLVNI